MSEFHVLDAEREGRRGSTIDSEEKDRWMGIPVSPKIPGCGTHHPVSYHQPGVDEIRGGTPAPSRGRRPPSS
jgi:hypothetical protein